MSVKGGLVPCPVQAVQVSPSVITSQQCPWNDTTITVRTAEHRGEHDHRFCLASLPYPAELALHLYRIQACRRDSSKLLLCF